MYFELERSKAESEAKMTRPYFGVRVYGGGSLRAISDSDGGGLSGEQRAL
jgi:hypothetical protein